MRIDQEPGVEIVAIFGKAGQMNLADMLHGKRIEIGHRLEAVIDRGDIDVVDVEQEPAAGAADDRAQEFGLAHGRVREGDIGRRVFEQDGALKGLLHLVDMVRHAGQRRLVIGQRQKVVEIDAVMRRPGEMLREERG